MLVGSAPIVNVEQRNYSLILTFSIFSVVFSLKSKKINTNNGL